MFSVKKCKIFIWPGVPAVPGVRGVPGVPGVPNSIKGRNLFFEELLNNIAPL